MTLQNIMHVILCKNNWVITCNQEPVRGISNSLCNHQQETNKCHISHYSIVCNNQPLEVTIDGEVILYPITWLQGIDLFIMKNSRSCAAGCSFEITVPDGIMQLLTMRTHCGWRCTKHILLVRSHVLSCSTNRLFWWIDVQPVKWIRFKSPSVQALLIVFI